MEGSARASVVSQTLANGAVLKQQMSSMFPEEESGMNQSILLISAMMGIENCATNLSRQLGLPVDSAADKKEGIAALKRRNYGVVVVDESIVEPDPRCAELLWRYAGLAIPMQVNFALSGTARLSRDIRAAIARREQ